jgi:hypothetical protein
MTNNTKQPTAQEQKHTSLFQQSGLSTVESALHKIPFIGKALPFLIVNLFMATIFHYATYSILWIMARKGEGLEWFVRYTDYLGKSHSRFTIHAAEQIGFFVGGAAACLFTYANFSDTDTRHFLIKTALVSLIPLSLLIIAKAFPTMPFYIPLGLVYGQLFALIIVCIVKLVGGDEKAKTAKK